MLLILMGKTCSGKDTIANYLCKNHGFKKIVTYTTRPVRPGEVDGVTYHYINGDEFKSKIEAGYFVEWKVYNTAFGDWYYGCSKDSLMDTENGDYLVILTPDGIRDLKKSGLNCNYKIVYVNARDSVIKTRLINRGDDPDESMRRISADRKDFEKADILADLHIHNNDRSQFGDLINMILRKVKDRTQYTDSGCSMVGGE